MYHLMLPQIQQIIVIQMRSVERINRNIPPIVFLEVGDKMLLEWLNLIKKCLGTDLNEFEGNRPPTPSGANNNNNNDRGFEANILNIIKKITPFVLTVPII